MHSTYHWLCKMGLRETSEILCVTIMTKSVPLRILRKDGYLGKKKRRHK